MINDILMITKISITQSTIITSPIGFNIGLTNVDTRLKQRCINVVSTSGTDVVSTLCNVENPTLDFVSFSTSDQRYFKVDSQRWNNVDPTLKCWLGWILYCWRHYLFIVFSYLFFSHYWDLLISTCILEHAYKHV